MKVVLTIAGSDSCGGAGLQMDLKVFHACGVHGATVVTALTAQNTEGVQRVHHVPPRFVAAQIDAVARDLPIAAAKTGMLARAPVVEQVAERIARRRLSNLVVDPVLFAKDGTPLLTGRGLAALKERLLPRAFVVTPNLHEAEALSGEPVWNEATMARAAERIQALGVPAVLVTGGHLPGEPVDLLLWEGQLYRIEGPRLGERAVHGTGCVHSAALAAALARGVPLPEACRRARRWVEAAIRGAVALGRGTLLAQLPLAEPGETEDVPLAT